MFLSAAGYSVYDYGSGITTDKLCNKIIEDDIKYLLMSTLMLRAALNIKVFVDVAKSKTPDLKVIVGGAPFLFDDNLWNKVGADAIGKNAFEALNLIKKFEEVSS